MVREKQIPVFLRVQTARYKEHVGPGEDFSAGYRSEEDINKWKALDPLINNPTLEKFKAEISAEINEALDFAYKSAVPTREELLTDVL